MDIQWYPGHMTKAKRQMQEDLKLVDVLVEVLDARAPHASKNPDLDAMANGKARVLLLNKSDLADDKKTGQWVCYYKDAGFFVAKVNAKAGSGVKIVREVIEKSCAKKRERDAKRGIVNRPLRAMIVGIPNVGKSTLINSLAKKACTKTGNRPGVTTGKQWIRLNQQLELLDTPGILWPKFADPDIGRNLAFIGSIKDDVIQLQELSLLLLDYLQKEYPGAVAEFYRIREQQDSWELLTQVAGCRGCLKPKGELDLEKAARLFTDDFRAGKIGKISLEAPFDGRI